MKVLVIGGAGRVGHMIVGPLSRRHTVRVADRGPGKLRQDGIEVVTVDVTDAASLRRAMSSQQALIYAAMGRQEDWGTIGGWAESHFDVNVKGVYLALQTAAAAGVRRVVYASSVSIFESYLDRGHELQESEPDATDAYGLSKRLGEQACIAAAHEHGLEVVSLRLCGPLSNEEYLAYDGPQPEIYTAGSDVAAAFDAALTCHVRGFEAFVVCGDHDEKYLSWSRTHNRLGWAPQFRPPAS